MVNLCLLLGDYVGEGGSSLQEPTTYKTEPTTPTTTCHQMIPDATYPNYPCTAFTPSPSSSGCESPRTPGYTYYPPHLPTEGSSVPYPAPTPPLSATHHSKDSPHALPPISTNMQLHEQHSQDKRTGCSQFTEEQVDCICDSLQQREDIETLGKCLTFP